MPNTPRTLAALDALYADNNAGAISAQDLRDGFHSVAQPVTGGGFGMDPAVTSFLWKQSKTGGIDGVRDLYGGPDPFTDYDPTVIGFPAFNFLEHSGAASYYLYDPDGWLVAAEQPSPDFWGATIPANSSIELQPGIYGYDFQLTWSGTPAAGTTIRSGPFVVQDTTLTDPIAQATGDYTALQSDYYNVKDLESSYGQAWQGFMTLAAPSKWFFSTAVDGGAATLHIIRAGIKITRLA